MSKTTKIISMNLNGIRSAATKGFFAWLIKQEADIICIQETKAHMQHLQDAHFRPEGYHSFFCDAEKKGYSGVGIYCREAPLNISTGLGWQVADTEGRYIQADFPGYSVASLYMPSGTSGEERQACKFEFMSHYLPILQKIRAEDRSFIVCGDWNIAHRNIDLKNWRGNQKNSGFLPEERAWLDQLFDQVGWVDAFRVVNSSPDQYTWWSHRGRAWENNVGWRIDYQIVTPDLRDKICAVEIYREQKFSDHAPLIIKYQL